MTSLYRAYSFWEKVDLVFQILSDNGNESFSDPEAYRCEPDLDDQLYYQLCLIPAFVIVLLFSLTQTRRNILIDCLKGRPGFIYPMDIMTHSFRLSYACAFGATVNLVYKVVFDSFYAFDYDGPPYLIAFAAMGSMLVYGMVFFPVFASLTIGSVYGYGIGAVYVWLMTAVQFYRVFYCLVKRIEAEEGLTYLFTALPEMVCLLYLSISIPVRCIISLRKSEFHVHSMEGVKAVYTLKAVKKSHYGIHVMGLLKRKKPYRLPENKLLQIKDCFVQFLSRRVYQWQPDFRYSSRMLTTMLVGAMILYQVASRVFNITDYAFDVILRILNDRLQKTEVVIEATNSETAKDLEDILDIAIIIFKLLRVVFLVSFGIAALLGVFSIISAFPSYRWNLQALYKGDYSRFGNKKERSNAELLAGCMRFAGYQVGYTAWGFIVQSLIILIFLLIVSTAITLFIYDISTWAVDFVSAAWPIPVVAVMIKYSQVVFAKLFFLQDFGNSLALTNRRIFFIVTYFLFFYNIFMGIISCLWRIIKSMLLGAYLLPRMDKGLLPRDFQFSDPGFAAYVGFLLVEHAHTHPVLLVFVHLLVVAVKGKQGNRNGKLSSSGEGDVNDETKCAVELAGFESYTGGFKTRSKSRSRIISRWHLYYTLLHNPQLKILRKGFLQSLRVIEGGLIQPVGDGLVPGGATAVQQEYSRHSCQDDTNPGTSYDEFGSATIVVHL